MSIDRRRNVEKIPWIERSISSRIYRRSGASLNGTAKPCVVFESSQQWNTNIWFLPFNPFGHWRHEWIRSVVNIQQITILTSVYCLRIYLFSVCFSLFFVDVFFLLRLALQITSAMEIKILNAQGSIDNFVSPAPCIRYGWCLSIV